MNLKWLKRSLSGFTIACPLNIPISYLVIMALSSSSIVQLKGLFGEPSLPLPLSLRAVRGVCGAVALISTGNQAKRVVPVIT